MMRRHLNRITRRILKPQVLRNIDVAGFAKPRKPVQIIDDKVYLAKDIQDCDEWRKRVEKSWDKIGRGISPGKSVLVKVNLNTADSYPASTDPDMLSALIDLLTAQGFNDILVGDCSSVSALPTLKTANTNGIMKIIEKKARFISFDHGPWVTVPILGEYLKSVTIPRLALEVDHIIHLANMKTHCLADFSLGLKLSVGYMHPLERQKMHKENLHQKLIEISLALMPDLTIIDGRKAFITGGPVAGKIVDAGTVIMGINPLAVDLEAYRQLYALKQSYDCLEEYRENPWDMLQFRHARDIGLGSRLGDEYLTRFI